MKYIFTICVLLCCFSYSSAQITDLTTKKIDDRFIGTWTGSEKDKQVKGLTKYWVQDRSENGTYLILFTIIDNKGKVQSSAEKGRWWVTNNVFYETPFSSGTETPTTYTFEFLDGERIKFKVKSSSVSFDDENYQFIDTKIDY